MEFVVVSTAPCSPLKDNAPLPPDSLCEQKKVPADDDFGWYLLRCFATYEVRCRDAVESRLYGSGFDDRVKEVWVPCRQVRV